MGYDVHITRKEDWFDENGPEISLDEWVAYVNGDPEMRLDGFAQAENGRGDVLQIESPGISVWVSYSGHGADGNMAWFSYQNGGVVVKNPDKEILVKMWRIAQSLSARVQGDEGELYDEKGEVLGGSRSSPIVPQGQKRTWWKLR